MNCKARSIVALLRVPGWAVIVAASLLAGCLAACFCDRAWAEEPQAEASAAFQLRTDRGRVVWLAEAMERLHGVKFVAEARERTLALETSEGRLFPLVEDNRGRAFRKDKRLREMGLELLSRQHKGTPLLQVIRVYEQRDGRRFEVDYWCEICSIAIFELKACDCCQGPIELRLREVDSSGNPAD